MAQADTIVPAGVQGYDRYAYSNNSPVVYIDPSGHDPISIIALLILAGVGAFSLSGCTPSPPTYDDVQSAIDDAHNTTSFWQAGNFDNAIDLAVDYYDIDTSAATKGPHYDSSWDEVYREDGSYFERAVTTDEGEIIIFASAFDNPRAPNESTSPGLLAAIIDHETIHASQLEEGRWYADGNTQYVSQGEALNEYEAHTHVVENATRFGLTDEELADLNTTRDHYYSLMNENTRRLADEGIYVLP